MKKTIIYLTAMMMAATVSGETLTPAEALARVQGNSPARKIAARVSADVAPVRVIATEGEPEMYMFAPSDGGMLLVSAESETPALIGYSENFIADGELPPAMEGMMRCWAAEIAAQRAGAVIYGPGRAAEDFAAIEPICQTRWNQDGPYNDKCPVQNGQRTYTGCVATAMAQVLKVYEYPAKCSGGTYTYYWSAGGKNLSLNFDEVTLDWANMTNSYSNKSTQAQKDAVATLMQALGYSCDMGYTIYGSGAVGSRIASGLANFFDYDKGSIGYYNRDWFTLAQWQQKVYETLAEGYPIYYDGVTIDSEPVGHAFVVDGYRSNGYFHLNWGWGGMSDGYFLLTALDPDAQGIGGAYSSAGFDAAQGAVFGLKKGNSTADSNIPLRFYTTGGFKTSSTSATLGKSVSFNYTGSQGAAYNIGIATTQSVYPAVKFTNENGTVYAAYQNYDYGAVRPLYGIGAPTVIIPSTLPAGNYTVTPAVYSGKTKEYYDVYTPIGYGGYVKATVSGNTIKFSSAELASIKAEEFTAPEIIYVDKAFDISGSISATNAESYCDLVYVRLYSGSTSKGNIGQFMMNVDSGTTAEFSASVILTSKKITSGKYNLVLIDVFGNQISDPVGVELVSSDDAGALRASGLKCLDSTSENLSFEVTVTASDGNHRGPVYIELHQKGNYNDYVARIASESISVADGASESVTITGTFPEGVVGQDYTAYVYYLRSGEWTEAAGRQRLNFTLTEQTSIDELSIGESDLSAEYFDMQGRKVNPQKGGIYLMRRNGEIRKVRL